MQREEIHISIDQHANKPKEDTINKRLAAMEVYRWVNKTYITALGGVILVFLMFGVLIYAGEGLAFLVTSATLAFFAWQLGIAARYRYYLKARYRL